MGKVVVHIEDGMVLDVTATPGIDVEVRDYTLDFQEECDVKKDEDGCDYVEIYRVDGEVKAIEVDGEDLACGSCFSILLGYDEEICPCCGARQDFENMTKMSESELIAFSKKR